MWNGRRSQGPDGEQSPPEPPTVDGVVDCAFLGGGGCATVWVGRSVALGHDVAVKVPRTGGRAPELLERFAEEGRLLSRLRRHPNVVRVFGMTRAVLCDGTAVPAIVMELVPEAQSLLRHCQSRSLDLRARLRLFRAACAGVAHLHRAGVIHLDLKPSNILVDAQGVPRIADLGAALTLLDDDPQRTFFTPQYASPEQLRCAKTVSTLEQTSDVYSLGKILAALLGGAEAVALPPGQWTVEERSRHALDWSPSSALSRLDDPDEALCEVLLRATDPDPHHRYHDARELVGAIDDLLQPWPLRTARHAAGVVTSLPRGARRFGARCAGVALSAALAIAASFVIVLALHRAARIAVVDPHAAAAQDAPVAEGPIQAVVDQVPAPTSISEVCVVRIPSDVDLTALARRCGGADLDPQRPWTFRHVHAALIDRLAELGAATVALDVEFPSTPAAAEPTAAIVQAIERARALHRCPVVVGTRCLSIDPGPELLEPGLRNVVAGWGSIEGFEIEGVGRTMPMLAQTSEGATACGLALAAVRASGRVEMATLESDGVFLRGGTAARRLLRPSAVRQLDEFASVLAQPAALAGALVAVHSSNLPPRPDLDAITIDAQTLLAPDADDRLASLVRGRIAIVSNNIGRRDEHPTRTVGGMPVFMPWWHACAVETMLHPTTAGPRDGLVLLGMTAAAAVGFGLAAPMSVAIRRWARRRGLSGRRRLGLAALACGLTVLTLGAVGAVLAAIRPGVSIELLSVALALLFGIVVAVTSVAVAARSWTPGREGSPRRRFRGPTTQQEPRHAQRPVVQ